jgi:thiamine pyrophosphokinase
MTSRPALKGYVRSRNALLRSADKLIALFSKGQDLDTLLANVFVLRKAFSVAQHHDAVAGTEKQHVADDYAKLMANGTVAVQTALSPLLANMTQTTGAKWEVKKKSAFFGLYISLAYSFSFAI